MNDFLLIGTLAGLLFGLFHAIYMARLVSNNAGTSGSTHWASVLNFTLWTLALWLIMGSYLLGFWLISAGFYIVFKAFRS
jgi:hypothetical protein